MKTIEMKDIRDHRSIISVDGEIIEILDAQKDGLVKGFGYINADDNMVYIYAGKIKKNLDVKPGCVYKDKGGELKFIKHTEEIHDKFKLENVVRFSRDDLLNGINNDEDFKSIDPRVLEQSDNYFAPIIKEEDDILKRIIKRALLEKKINPRDMREKFKNDYDVTNMKSALTKSAPLSIKYFIKWVEVLDLSVKIVTALENCDGDSLLFEELLK